MFSLVDLPRCDNYYVIEDVKKKQYLVCEDITHDMKDVFGSDIVKMALCVTYCINKDDITDDISLEVAVKGKQISTGVSSRVDRAVDYYTEAVTLNIAGNMIFIQFTNNNVSRIDASGVCNCCNKITMYNAMSIPKAGLYK